MDTIDIEIAVAAYFNARVNLIVPNISWGMSFGHECDLFVLTPSGYGYEIEIKISKSDLKADLAKLHQHRSLKIKKLYFAIPEKLSDCIDFIPKRAGILIATEHNGGRIIIEKKRDAVINCNYKFSEVERWNLARLGALRIFPLKRSLKEANKNYKSVLNKLHDITSKNGTT